MKQIKAQRHACCRAMSVILTELDDAAQIPTAAATVPHYLYRSDTTSKLNQFTLFLPDRLNGPT
jgi:hypothetical protein